MASEMMDSREAIGWAALMAGRPELKGCNIDFVREQLNAWWEDAAEGFSARVNDLPAICWARLRSHP
jgi:hypothetical protein